MMHLLLRFLIVDLSVSMSKVMFTSFRLTLGVGECVGVSSKTKFFFCIFFLFLLLFFPVVFSLALCPSFYFLLPVVGSPTDTLKAS